MGWQPVQHVPRLVPELDGWMDWHFWVWCFLEWHQYTVSVEETPWLPLAAGCCCFFVFLKINVSYSIKKHINKSEILNHSTFEFIRDIKPWVQTINLSCLYTLTGEGVFLIYFYFLINFFIYVFYRRIFLAHVTDLSGNIHYTAVRLNSRFWLVWTCCFISYQSCCSNCGCKIYINVLYVYLIPYFF